MLALIIHDLQHYYSCVVMVDFRTRKWYFMAAK